MDVIGVLLIWAVIGMAWFANRMRSQMALMNANQPSFIVGFLGGPIVWILALIIAIKNRKMD